MSQQPQSFLVLDSLNATPNVASNNSTFPINTNDVRTAPHSFNTVWKMNAPINNVARVYMKSLTLPCLWPNIRSSNGSNTLTVKNGAGTAYTITLPDRTYKDITTLLTSINSAFTLLGVSVSFGLYDALLKVIAPSDLPDALNTYGNICLQSTDPAMTVVSGILATQILGFSGTLDVRNNTYTQKLFCASNPYNLNYDQYVNMVFYTLPTHNIANQNGTSVSFHIPVPASSGTIMYSSSNLAFDSYLSNETKMPITQIGVVITDRFGYSINSRGIDWSVCLAMEYDDGL